MIKTNKKVKYLLLVFVLAIVVFATSQYFDSKFIGNNDLGSSHFYSSEGLEFGGFGNEKKEEAIANYLLSKEEFSWRTRDDSHNFCVIENLGQEDDLFPMYVWAFCGEYIMKEAELENLSGISVPVKVYYPNELSYYDLKKFTHKVPENGTDYESSIRRIFPEDVQQKIFGYDAEPLVVRAENIARENIGIWESVKMAIHDCQVVSVMQFHDLTVVVELKDGTVLEAKEPKIDDIFDIVNQYRGKCGEMIMATE